MRYIVFVLIFMASVSIVFSINELTKTTNEMIIVPVDYEEGKGTIVRYETNQTIYEDGVVVNMTAVYFNDELTYI